MPKIATSGNDPQLSLVDEYLTEHVNQVKKMESDLTWLHRIINLLQTIKAGRNAEPVIAHSANGKRILSASARKAISRAQKVRWAKHHNAAKKAASFAAKETVQPKAAKVSKKQNGSNFKSVWTNAENNRLVKAIATASTEGPTSAPDIARKLAPKFNRTVSALRQRMFHMSVHKTAINGYILKEQVSNNGGGPPHTVIQAVQEARAA